MRIRIRRCDNKAQEAQPADSQAVIVAAGEPRSLDGQTIERRPSV